MQHTTAQTLKLIALTVALTVPATTAVAGPPHTVEPSSMTPPLNSDFSPWTCTATGTGITCTGEVLEEYTNMPTDIVCDGAVAYATGRFSARTVRWHDPDGRAVKTEIHTGFSDRLSLSPDGAGSVVVFSGHWQKHYDYPDPGVADTRVLTETGAIYRFTSPDEGILYQDTGTVTFVPGHENELVDSMHGIHELYDRSVTVNQAVCSGLS